MTADPFRDRLHDAGLRATKPRLAVLEALSASPHADAAAVLSGVRDRVGHVSRQAVYDCLDALTAAGLVRRFRAIGAATRFELRTDDHDHLACRSCGALVDVPGVLHRLPRPPPADQHGFTIDEAEVVYWGTCPACSTP